LRRRNTIPSSDATPYTRKSNRHFPTPPHLPSSPPFPSPACLACAGFFYSGETETTNKAPSFARFAARPAPTFSARAGEAATSSRHCARSHKTSGRAR
jgi:hypothetical protein